MVVGQHTVVVESNQESAEHRFLLSHSILFSVLLYVHDFHSRTLKPIRQSWEHWVLQSVPFFLPTCCSVSFLVQQSPLPTGRLPFNMFCCLCCCCHPSFFFVLFKRRANLLYWSQSVLSLLPSLMSLLSAAIWRGSITGIRGNPCRPDQRRRRESGSDWMNFSRRGPPGGSWLGWYHPLEWRRPLDRWIPKVFFLLWCNWQMTHPCQPMQSLTSLFGMMTWSLAADDWLRVLWWLLPEWLFGLQLLLLLEILFLIMLT